MQQWCVCILKIICGYAIQSFGRMCIFIPKKKNNTLTDIDIYCYLQPGYKNTWSKLRINFPSALVEFLPWVVLFFLSK